MPKLSAELQELQELMKIHYGFSSFRSGQAEAITSIINKEDTLVIMPTGGGKSLCYQLPALILPGITIVISPLIALMKDQVDQLTKRGIPATAINSTISPSETITRLQDIKKGRYKLLFIAPERFYSKEFINHLVNIDVSLFAIDEAHCISQWGHDFRPSYLRLKSAIDLVGRPPVIALTATATPEVREDIKKQINLQKTNDVITGFARPNLQFGVAKANDTQKYQIILQTIQSLPEPIGIVYAATRNKTDAILQLLIDNGIDAVGYHAGLDQMERKMVQNNFMNGRAPIIVATNAFGMGIDKSNIRFVIHADMPGNIESYYQEAGRAGRDGKSSVCLLLYSPRDRYIREFFIKGDNPDPELILDIYDILIGYEQNKVLITYGELKNQIIDDVPEMAIGTAVKILESAGYIQRSKETIGQANLQIADFNKAKQAIPPRARVQHDIFDRLAKNYTKKLQAGWQINLEDLADMIQCKKTSLQRLIKTLQEAETINYQPPFKGTEINIIQRVPRSEVEINFAKLKSKMSAAYDKLNKMENYVYHKNCRQKYLLDYFGDEKAAPCGKCDVCMHGGYIQHAPAKGQRFNKRTRFKSTRINDDSTNALKSVKVKTPLSTKLTQLETFELYTKGLDIKAIAKSRELTTGTVVNHICYLIEKKLPIDVDKLVPLNRQENIKKAFKKTKTDKLKDVKDRLDDSYSYDEIKLTLASN